jgi:hypothetical protein
MCKKLIIVITLSLCLVTSVSAGTIRWDFENGNDHYFALWSVIPAVRWFDDPNIAGDEAITGVGGHTHLPDAGLAWTVGPPNQFDGLIPAVEEGCHVVNGVLEYGPCNDPFDVFEVDPPSYINSRGQSGYLNTYNLSQWGDNLHTAANDQIATSPAITLGEGSVLTVWSHGGGSDTHAPEYDATDPDTQFYSDGSSGIAVLSAEEEDMYAILASVHTQGRGTLTEDTLDLSEFAGRRVFIEVVDAFEGSWGWLAIDEIQITNATVKIAVLVVQLEGDDGTEPMGLDPAVESRLKMLGYAVDVVEQGEIGDEGFTIDDANAVDLLVISESIGSSSADPLIGTTTPMMHQEAYGWDNWSFMGERTNIHWESGTDVDIVNDTHPIIVDANLSLGSMTFFDPESSWTTELVSMMAPGAELLAKITVDYEEAPADHAIVFAIEKGAELYDGNSAPNRVVGFSLPGLSGGIPAETMTDEAWAFFDAAIAWLNPPAPTAALIVSNTDLTAGFDQAQHDRLVSMGYEVTVATGDDVSSGAFTVEAVEAFDVLVVSESIGSSSVNNFIGANVPMMHQESYGWSRHYFTAGLQKTWVEGITQIDVVADHEILTDAGLSTGSLDFFSAPTNATSDLVAALAPGALNIAQVTSDANDFTLVFAIEQGAELSNGTPAANRVVGFSLPGTEPAIDAGVMTDDAWAFFEAAIRWLDAVD